MWIMCRIFMPCVSLPKSGSFTAHRVLRFLVHFLCFPAKIGVPPARGAVVSNSFRLCFPAKIGVPPAPIERVEALVACVSLPKSGSLQLVRAQVDGVGACVSLPKSGSLQLSHGRTTTSCVSLPKSGSLQRFRIQRLCHLRLGGILQQKNGGSQLSNFIFHSKKAPCVAGTARGRTVPRPQERSRARRGPGGAGETMGEFYRFAARSANFFRDFSRLILPRSLRPMLTAALMSAWSSARQPTKTQ